MASSALSPAYDKSVGEYAIAENPKDALGKGSFGSVFPAQKTMDFAAKKIALSAGKWQENEKSLAKLGLKHPNIITIYDVREEASDLWLFMERCDCNLAVYLHEEEHSFDCKTTIMTQTALAIEYLHKKKVSHRDLKPENILIQDKKADPVVKLTDFGLSKDLHVRSTMDTFCGTLHWMAPEFFADREEYKKKIDMFSMGLVLLYIHGTREDRLILSPKLAGGKSGAPPKCE